jgi:hypothetical protein
MGLVGRSAVGLGLAHRLAQRLVMNPEISRDVTHRPPGLDGQPHTAIDQRLGVLPSSWHRWRVSCPEDGSSSIRSLRETRPASNLLGSYR